jgi:hypothetical protein
MSNTTSFIIRFTNQEKATLQKLALLEGKNMTDYIKSKIFKLDQENTKKVEKISSQSQNNIEQYLDTILKIVLTNNGIISKTIAKDFTEEQKQNLKHDVNERMINMFKI